MDEKNIYKNDTLGRKKDVQDLVRRISVSPKGAQSIVIYGEWGSGKSFFADLLQKQLLKENFLAVKVNAWKIDYLNDPLIGIIAEIDEEIKSGKFKSIAPLHSGWNKIYKVAKESFTHSLAVATGTASVKPVVEAVENFIKVDALEEFKLKSKSLNTLKEQLNIFVKETLDIGESSIKAPLVIIIDELDRCKPTFTLQLLERMNQVFGIEGICFVSMVHEKAICEMIKHSYGEGIEPKFYLNKFFTEKRILDVRITTDASQQLLNMAGYSQLLEIDGLQGVKSVYEEEMHQFLADIAVKTKLGMREFEQAIEEYVTFLNKEIENGNYGTHLMNLFSPLFAFVLFLKKAIETNKRSYPSNQSFSSDFFRDFYVDKFFQRNMISVALTHYYYFCFNVRSGKNYSDLLSRDDTIHKDAQALHYGNGLVKYAQNTDREERDVFRDFVIEEIEKQLPFKVDV